MNVAIVSTYQPQTHYVRYLFVELNAVKDSSDVIKLYVDRIQENALVKSQNILPLWTTKFSSIKDIKRQAEKDKIDVFHLQHEFNMYGGIKGVVYFLFLLFSLRKYKKVVTFHAVIDSGRIDEKFLETFALGKFKNLKRIIKFSFKWFYKATSLFCDKFIVLSQYLKEVLIEAYQIPRDKIAVLPIGVCPLKSCDIANLRENSPWISKVDGKKFILFFGYLLKRKGLDLLMDAFSELKGAADDYRLVVAGGVLEGYEEYAQSLYQKAKDNKMEDRIIFTGFLSESEISWLYANCCFVVFPYQYSISSSLPLSMAFGVEKPVLASDVKSLKDNIKDGENGLLFLNGNKDDLKKKLNQMCFDERLMAKLRQGAAQQSQEQSWKNVAQKTKGIYQSII